MAVGQQADDQALDHGVLPDDDPSDLAQQPLDEGALLVDPLLDGLDVVVHVASDRTVERRVARPIVPGCHTAMSTPCAGGTV